MKGGKRGNRNNVFYVFPEIFNEILREKYIKVFYIFEGILIFYKQTQKPSKFLYSLSDSSIPPLNRHTNTKIMELQ